MRNNIQPLREAAGLTQEELARKLGVTRQTINAIENDKYNPTLQLAFKLATLFGCLIEQVFNYDANLRKDEQK